MKRSYLIDHKILFFIGFSFYLIVPYIVGRFELLSDYPGMTLFYSLFRQIPTDKLNTYLIITLSWLFAFYLGHICYSLYKPYKRYLHLYPATPTSRSIFLLAILLFITLLVIGYLSRNLLFTGYSVYEINSRGKMNTLLVLYNFFILYQLVSNQRISRLLIVGIILAVLLSLSMGGRTYVVQTFMAFLIYKTSFTPKRWKPVQLLLVTAFGFIIASFVGLWRMGSSFNLHQAYYSLLAEPLFTWFSTSTFLPSNPIPFINIPLNFLSSFINLLPNTLFNFNQYVIKPQEMGFTYLNPLGADSVWTTYIINFGILGSFFFVFTTGFIMNYLRHLSESSRFAAVYYILVCSILPFQFFRDGFFIINKQLFFNFLFLPGLLLVLLKCVIYLFPGKSNLSKEHLPLQAI